MAYYYILENKIPVEAEGASLEEQLKNYVAWEKENSRVIKRTKLTVTDTFFNKEQNAGFVEVSTIFLGLDHRFSPEHQSEPVLFETMIFGGPLDQYLDRCCTWEGALRMHELAIEKAKNGKL